MRTDRQCRDLWETSHRIQDLAETLEEMSDHCQFSTALELRHAATTLWLEVRRIRKELVEDGRSDAGAAVPGRLL
jgi:dimeric dUTPase (all-alpha-NTP-PPase superfamily)